MIVQVKIKMYIDLSDVLNLQHIFIFNPAVSSLNYLFLLWEPEHHEYNSHRDMNMIQNKNDILETYKDIVLGVLELL